MESRWRRDGKGQCVSADGTGRLRVANQLVIARGCRSGNSRHDLVCIPVADDQIMGARSLSQTDAPAVLGDAKHPADSQNRSWGAPSSSRGQLAIQTTGRLRHVPFHTDRLGTINQRTDPQPDARIHPAVVVQGDLAIGRKPRAAASEGASGSAVNHARRIVDDFVVTGWG